MDIHKDIALNEYFLWISFDFYWFGMFLMFIFKNKECQWNCFDYFALKIKLNFKLEFINKKHYLGHSWLKWLKLGLFVFFALETYGFASKFSYQNYIIFDLFLKKLMDFRLFRVLEFVNAFLISILFSYYKQWIYNILIKTVSFDNI